MRNAIRKSASLQDEISENFFKNGISPEREAYLGSEISMLLCSVSLHISREKDIVEGTSGGLRDAFMYKITPRSRRWAGSQIEMGRRRRG